MEKQTEAQKFWEEQQRILNQSLEKAKKLGYPPLPNTEASFDLDTEVTQSPELSEETMPIGRWGHEREKYLKQVQPEYYMELQNSGQLNEHLLEVEDQAWEMMDSLTAQMAQAQGVTEQMKSEDQMKWVGLMNNIQAAARKIVRQQLIHT